jgi:N-acetylmuramoyl-L-alanine amidase
MTNNHRKKKSYTKKQTRKTKKTSVHKRTVALRIAAAAAIAVCAVLIVRSVFFDPGPAAYTNPNGIVFSSTLPDGSVSSGTDLNAVPHGVEINVEEKLLTPNEFSRPTDPLANVNGIVVHYTANPGSTAAQNRDYFEGLKDGTSGTYASSHFIIGLDGEIIQCIPLDEISYASNERNPDTISIECCHPDESGEFTQETYQSLVDLTAWLCEEYSLTGNDVIRHYDVTGKECPKYFVDNEDKWNEFRTAVDTKLS